MPLSLLNTAESILIECYLSPGLYTGKTQLIIDQALVGVNKTCLKKKKPMWRSEDPLVTHCNLMQSSDIAHP